MDGDDGSEAREPLRCQIVHSNCSNTSLTPEFDGIVPLEGDRENVVNMRKDI
jgi:hypothetical protein